MAASPSSSPRLPSPPPIAEDQLGPKSPVAMPNEHGELGRNPFEANASRRIRPGTKAADMALGPPLVPLTDIDSPFQLTEHLKSLHNAALHRDGSSTISPIDRETATRLAQPPEGVDKYLWLYELCRLLCKEINAMIVALFQDDPPCSAQTCTEMRASEWQYLCAVHDPPKPCCAIDYCCHTLDWTNHVLTSQKNFPSRMALGDGAGAGSQSASGQLRQLTNIFRRVYRIFAHAWFQHREMYWKVELKSGLYVFFKTVCDVYSLIPEDNYTVPPEAEGIEPSAATAASEKTKPSIMKRKEDGGNNSGSDQEGEKPHPKGMLTVADGATTKRHRSTPSMGSESITTVMEDPEEEDDKTNKLEETIILSSEPPEYSPVAEEAPSKDERSVEEQAESSAKEEAAPETETDADVPIIAVDVVEEAEKDVSAEAAGLSSEPEPEKETEAEAEPAPAASTAPAVAVTADAGEKEEKEVPPTSSAASDTDSHGSWQVLTNESQPSSTSTDEEIPTSATKEAVLPAQEEDNKEEEGEEVQVKVEQEDDEAEAPSGGSSSAAPPTEPEAEPSLPAGSGSSREAGGAEDVAAKVEVEEKEEEVEKETKEPEAVKEAVDEKEEKDEKKVDVKEKDEEKADPKADAKDAGEATKTVDD